MKKLFLSFILCVFAICAYAQEHLSFNGIPMDDSLNSFCQKLADKGFTQIGIDNNVTLFTGVFTGRQATVGIGATDDGINVLSVVVLFEASKEWDTLVNTYDYYKEIYTRKYGKPSISKENNLAPINTNSVLMSGLHHGTVNYISKWEVPGGTIQLSIEKYTENYKGIVSIVYLDSQNFESKIQSDLEEI